MKVLKTETVEVLRTIVDLGLSEGGVRSYLKLDDTWYNFLVHHAEQSHIVLIPVKEENQKMLNDYLTKREDESTS